jgi:outer membrane autotransporter protein
MPEARAVAAAVAVHMVQLSRSLARFPAGTVETVGTAGGFPVGGLTGPIGGGGGGGAGGYGTVITGSSLSLTNNATLTGGTGGAGGRGGQVGGRGGDGGSGGIGLDFVTTSNVLLNGHTIAGGAGGSGGAGQGDDFFYGNGGDGGNGGAGIVASDLVVTNTGSITGGNGGAAGTTNDGIAGQAGVGGAGVAGSSLTIYNSGTIAGGLSGDGATRADAISFTGGTNTLELQAGSNILGNVSAFSSADTLRLGGGTNSSFDVSQIGASAQYQGFGIFQKTGGSTWTLTGSNTAAQSWTLGAGTLSVNGTIENASVTVSGGKLGGSGTVRSVVVQSGGTFAPGNSIGTTTVSGDVNFASGSVYEVEVNDGGTTAGTNNDLISATGTATLDSGASVTVLAENGTDNGSSYAAVSTYTILTASGGITGTFGSLSENFAFLDGALSYDTLNVYLTLTRNAAGLTSVAQTLNQTKTASAIVDLGTGSSLYGAVISQSASGARAAFDDLSGEIHASLSTVVIEDARLLRNAAYDRSRSVRTQMGAVDLEPGGTTAQTATYGDSFSAADNALWMTAIGGFGDWSSTGNTASLSSSSGGFLAGADGVLGDAVHLGLMAGYQRANVDVKARSSTSKVDSYLFGAYGSTSVNALALRFGGSYSWHGIDTDRDVTVGNFSDSLSADYTGRTLQAFAEAGYEIDLGAYSLEPFAGLAHVNLHTDGFTESGGAAALTVNAATSSATFTTLGLRAAGIVNFDQTAVNFHGGLGWQHAFGPLNPSVQNSFAGGADFTVWGAPIARDVLTVDAGLDIDLAENTTFGVAYGGYLSGESALHDVKANLTFRF